MTNIGQIMKQAQQMQAKMAELQEQLADLEVHGAAGGDMVGALFITVDPSHDTPARLADFVARVHPRLVGLTGAADEIERVQRAYLIGARSRRSNADVARRLTHPLPHLLRSARPRAVAALRTPPWPRRQSTARAGTPTTRGGNRCGDARGRSRGRLRRRS